MAGSLTEGGRVCQGGMVVFVKNAGEVGVFLVGLWGGEVGKETAVFIHSDFLV